MVVDPFGRSRFGNLSFTEKSPPLRSEFLAPPRGGKGLPDPLPDQSPLGTPPTPQRLGKGGQGLRPSSPLAPLTPLTVCRTNQGGTMYLVLP
jgi:hypothetical protein